MILKLFLYLISVCGILFFLTVLPMLVSNLVLRKSTKKSKRNYFFSDDLFDGDYATSDYSIDRFSLKTRGSVRLAHGKVLSQENLEEKRQNVYSVDLP